MITAIRLVKKRELMREGGIAMRTIDAAWDGAEVADDDLKRMADAAERVAQRRRDSEKEVAAAVAWLKKMREEIGLTALAKMLSIDGPNLQKVIGGKRNPPGSIMQKFRIDPVNNEVKR